jgi:microcystin-dependent protein
VGQKVGVQSAALTAGELPAHTHGQNVRSTVVTDSGSTKVLALEAGSDAEIMSQGNTTNSAGSGDEVSRMQPSLVMRKIIKY